MHPAPGEIDACWQWEPGAWRSVGELQAVLEVGQRFEDRAGSAQAAQRAIGGVTIRRISQGRTAYWWPSTIIIADYSFDRSGGDLERQWGPKVAIAHEFAHFWDAKASNLWQLIVGEWELSSGLRDAVQGEPGPTRHARTHDASEDWAESVAGYVFPEYFVYLPLEDPGEVREYRDPQGVVHLLPRLLPRHYSYVAAQFRNLSASTP